MKGTEKLMEIRKTRIEDLPAVMKIYEGARRFMAQTGNPKQWGATNWPPESVIREDIRLGRSYAVTSEDGRVIGVFCYIFGRDIDPTYRNIEGGNWFDDSAYGVVHRMAGDGSERGIGRFCLNWALQQSGHLRVD
ncbi:MAG: GNAT family N-acetyltransferase, partial [Eubacterium sp.]